MKAIRSPRRSIWLRLTLLIALLLVAFSLFQGILYNTITRHQTIQRYGQTMHHDAYAISQNLSEMLAPSDYDGLDDTRFMVSEETLAPYLAMVESLTNCSVYIVDVHHDLTGYFDGVVQKLEKKQLPAYLEQSVALGFMGKTPFIQAEVDGDTRLSTCMPVMNVHSQVLGVVLLDASLRELGYSEAPAGQTLMYITLIALGVSMLLSFVFSRWFTHPISRMERVAHMLSDGDYSVRTAIRQKDEVGSLAQSMDVLAQRLQAARERDEELRKQQQQFFSNISHELRTPVTVIRGSVEALRDGIVTVPAEVRAYYDQVLRESQWLQRLIHDLLELSRLQNAEFTLDSSVFNLSDLLGDVAMSTHALCDGKGVVFHCQEPLRDYAFTGDYTRLRQMLLAAADNAVKFTPAGKSVRLWLDHESPVIGIADEGAGIPEEDMPHIFDRFRSTRSANAEGTGLGLAIAGETASRHGVQIRVESKSETGTVFLFVFPTEAKPVK